MQDHYFRIRNFRGQQGFSSSALLTLAVGIMVFALGLISLFQGDIIFKGSYARVTKPAAIAVIVISLVILRAGYKGMIDREPAEVKYYKCPSCGLISSNRETPGLNCPKCSVTMEKLEGFFDRHPELK